MWRANGLMVNLPRNNVQRDNWKQRFLHSWWKRGAATPISNIDNFVKHVYREHHQEADHWADIGPQGRRKIDIYRNPEPQHGNRYVASWMEVSKPMGRAAAES